MLRKRRKKSLPHEPSSEPRKAPDRCPAAGNFKAHRTRQIALSKRLIFSMKMPFFEHGYFPIENDLRRNGKSKTNHIVSK
jgi:hypothetical protein